MDKVGVTQADIDAAKDAYGTTPFELDDLFARHRIESQRPLLEALEDLVNNLAIYDEDGFTEEADFMTNARAAIKQAKGE